MLASGHGTNTDPLTQGRGLVASPVTPPAVPTSQLWRDCQNSSDANSGRYGAVWNRMSWCARWKAYDVVYRGATPIGWVIADFSFIGYGRDDGTRNIKVFLKADWVQFGGLYGLYTTLTATGLCTHNTVGCSTTGAAKSKTLQQWTSDLDKWESFTVNSDESKSGLQDKTLYHPFNIRMTFTGGSSEDTYEYYTRCDSASYFAGRPKACIFHDIMPNLQYRLYEANGTTPTKVHEVARHIRDAFQHTDDTYPKEPGKRKIIPGDYNDPVGDDRVSKGLKRVPYDSPDWRANAAAKTRACNRVAEYADTGLPTPPGENQQCDEFPFATTVQGSAHPYWDFSVRAVDSSQNGAAGLALQNYYLYDRILYYDLDEFWVKILDK